NLDRRLIAFENDGSVKWIGDATNVASSWGSALALYDLDGDGSVEILSGCSVYDASGHLRWSHTELDTGYQTVCTTPFAADLDGDGRLEVIQGHAAYHADGSPYWSHPELAPANAHIANLDGDLDPE